MYILLVPFYDFLWTRAGEERKESHWWFFILYVSSIRICQDFPLRPITQLLTFNVINSLFFREEVASILKALKNIKNLLAQQSRSCKAYRSFSASCRSLNRFTRSLFLLIITRQVCFSIIIYSASLSVWVVDEIRRCQTEKRRRRRGFICCPDLKRRHPIRFKVASFSVGRDEKKTDSHTLRRRKFQAPHAENPSRQTSTHTKTSTREKRAPWRTHNFVKAIRV